MAGIREGILCGCEHRVLSGELLAPVYATSTHADLHNGGTQSSHSKIILSNLLAAASLEHDPGTTGTSFRGSKSAYHSFCVCA